MYSRNLLLGLLQAGFIVGQTCPEIPDTGVVIGDPVPIRPDHIPPGCSEFEILVGKSWNTILHVVKDRYLTISHKPVEPVSQTTKLATENLASLWATLLLAIQPSSCLDLAVILCRYVVYVSLLNLGLNLCSIPRARPSSLELDKVHEMLSID